MSRPASQRTSYSKSRVPDIVRRWYSLQQRIVLHWLACRKKPADLPRLSIAGFAAAWLMLVGLPSALLLPRAMGEPAKQPSAGEIQCPLSSESTDEESTPTHGLPDYTSMTGYLEQTTLPREKPHVLWMLLSEIRLQSIDEPGEGPIEMLQLTDAVVGDGHVYLAVRGAPGKVLALDARDGAQVWQYEHTAAGITVEPAIDGDHVYFGSESGVTALRRDDGRVVWMHQLERGAGGGSPIPAGEHVYVSGYDGKAYAFHRSDGRLVWTHDFAEDAPPDQPGFPGERARFEGDAARPRGAACDGELFIQSVFDQSRVVAVDCATGQRRWSFQAGGWIGPEPTIADDRVYVCSQDKHLYCLDRATGKLIWKFLAPTWLASRVAVHDGVVFLPVHGPRLYQLDAESGEVIGTFIAKDEGHRTKAVYSFPMVTDRTVYFAAGEGQLYAVDIETSRLLWKLRPSESSELFTNPATDGRRIFVTSRQDIDDAGEAALIAIGPKR